MPAEYVANPLWSPMLREGLVTVHPLGGCAMGDDGSVGVVDHRGRVFAGEGRDVHDGLLVTDGAIVPRPLAVNPLLTISALSERAVELLAAEKGWTIGDRPDAAAAARRRPPPPRACASPSGWPAGPGRPPTATPSAAPRRARPTAPASSSSSPSTSTTCRPCSRTPPPPARLSGTVVAPALSPRRLRVEDGSFCLAQEDPTHVDTWHMRYSMRLAADDGRRFRFEGHKVLHDRFGLDLWSDTTTLYVTISDEAGTPVVGGVMRIAPTDFARQLTTLRVTGVDSLVERLRWKARFGAALLPLAHQRLRQPRRPRRVPRGPAAPHPAHRRRAPAAAPAGPRAALVRRRRPLARGRLVRGRRPRRHRLAAPRPLRGRPARPGAARRRVRHVGDVVPRRHRRDQPGRAPRARRLRRLAVRLPGRAPTSRRPGRRSRSTTSPGATGPRPWPRSGGSPAPAACRRSATASARPR